MCQFVFFFTGTSSKLSFSSGFLVVAFCIFSRDKKRIKRGFRSVVVITSALHAECRRFEPCRRQSFMYYYYFFFLGGGGGGEMGGWV